MKKYVLLLCFLLLFSFLIVPFDVQGTSLRYFEYPTETWIIEKQDYFGTFLEWNFIPIHGQDSNKTSWMFEWIQKDFQVVFNETTGEIIGVYENPIQDIVKHLSNTTLLKEKFEILQILGGFTNEGNFLSDCKRLHNYPVSIDPKCKKYFIKEPIHHLDLLNQKKGSFNFTLKKWIHGIRLMIGFKTTITYSDSANLISWTGGSQGSEIDCQDLYNEDIANNRTLLDENISTPEPPSPSEAIFLDTPFLYPACSKAMKIYFDISNFSRGGSLTIQGYDLDGGTQQEMHNINSSISFLTDYWYSDMTKLTFASGHEYHLNITQPRWGVVWKQETMQFRFDAKLQCGDGITETWFADHGIHILFSSHVVSGNSERLIDVKNDAHLRFGVIIDITKRTTKHGICLIFDNQDDRIYTRVIYGSSLAEIQLYSSTFRVIRQGGITTSGQLNNLYDAYVWNCILDGVHIISCYDLDISRITVYDAFYGVAVSSIIYANDISLYKNQWNLYFYGTLEGTFKNVVGRTPLTANVRTINVKADMYIINGDLDAWTFSHTGTMTHDIYRQYEFNLTVTFPNGTAIQNANVTLSYDGMGGGLIGSYLTDVNGRMNETLTMAFYNKTGGNTPFDFNPFHLNITYGDYWEYDKSFYLDRKIDWIIALHDPKPKDYALYLVGFCFILGVCSAILYVGWKKRKGD